MQVNKNIGVFRKELIGFGLLFMFLTAFFFMEQIKTGPVMKDLPGTIVHVNTIFLSILIEAIPFILLGVFVSALIQTFVSEESLQKYLPKNPVLAVLPAALFGLLAPICECAIVPVVRRLIKKGMPLHIGFVFLAAAPIVNPVVILSTYYAFRNDLTILYSRMGLGILVAIVTGLFIWILFRNSDQLKWSKEEMVSRREDSTVKPKMNRLKQTLYHASDEFFDTGKYIIIGAFLASLFQTLLDREFLLSIGNDEIRSTGIMMGLAFLLSVCSEADAFIAASFNGTFSKTSLIAFLVFGPMLDVKNAIMLFAYFKSKFVMVFITLITVLVFGSVLILSHFV
ncbi:permease [Fictibacillus fluitans]|uniref:Permease n=1 Tax=Fictibacillus fluitans TaxID=3058422 RepID=A0ABT8HZL6_9BACL|nr:permease [Fictibacillus sp. NE201]MDN4526178.1 permease [Fictibacillus sp. NE201]